MKKLFAVFTLVALVGCGDSKTSEAPKPKPQSLNGKTSQDVFQTKYNSVILSCSLWTQRSTKLNLSLPANDSVSLDLMTSPQLPATLTMNGKIDRHEIAVELKVTNLEILATLNHTDAKGYVYVAEHTPHVELDLSVNSKSDFEPGVVSSGTHSSHEDLYERVKSDLLSVSESSYPGGGEPPPELRPIHDHIRCVIATDIKPEYQYQFKSNAL